MNPPTPSASAAEVVVPEPPVPIPTVDPPPVRTTTYAQILKSTSLIGGSSAVAVAFSVVRTKAMAVLLGPAGVGFIVLYTSIAEVAQSLAGMGIQNSGVRQIAEAVGSGDEQRIGLTVAVVRKMTLLLGVAGALLLALFSPQVSQLTFGDRRHAESIALLAIAVLLRVVTAGQSALIQGTRRIADLARMSVIAAAVGTMTAIPMVYVFGERGIVPSLLTVAAASVLASWWYSSRLNVATPHVPLGRLVHEAGELLRLGVAFMASGFLLMGAAYVVQIIVRHHAGVAAAGLYQAAWAIGYLYVGFILQAMGSDFYPRLTTCANDHPECNRLVNEQAHVGLLIAGPGVIGTLTFAPVVIAVFYSAEFYPSVELLRWICLGMTLRIIVWPMGFIVLAKGAKQIFVLTEAAAAVFHVSLAWILVRQFGLTGSGAAFFGLYVCHGLLIYAIVRRMTGFRWTASNYRLGALFVTVIGLVFGSFYLLPSWLALTFGSICMLLSATYSLHSLVRLVPEHIPRPMAGWLVRLGVGHAPRRIT